VTDRLAGVKSYRWCRHQARERLVLGAGYPESGLVLVDALGVPVRPEAYSDKFHKLTRAAGLRETNPHLVRHTLAVAMDRAGIAPVDAAPLLGHTVETYISTYLRPSEMGARSAASGLGTALAGVV
jgi:integrase